MFLLETKKLKIHKLIEILTPKMDEIEYANLLKSIAQWGIREPLEIIPIEDEEDYYYIIDGRHRFLAANDLKLKKIPVVVIDIKEEDIENYIISKAIDRRNLTPEQKACLAIEWIEKEEEKNPTLDKDDLIKTACQKFAIRKDTLCLIQKAKKEDKELFYYIKSGNITLRKMKELELIKKDNLYHNFSSIFSDYINTEVLNEIYSKKLSDLEEREFKTREILNQQAQKENEIKKLKTQFQEFKRENEELKQLLSNSYVLLQRLSQQLQNNKTVINTEFATQKDLMNTLQAVTTLDFKNIEFNLSQEDNISEEDRKFLLRVEYILSFFLGLFETEEIKELYYILQHKKFPLTKSIVSKINSIFNQLSVFQGVILDKLAMNSLLQHDNIDIDKLKSHKYLVLQNLDKRG